MVALSKTRQIAFYKLLLCAVISSPVSMASADETPARATPLLVKEITVIDGTGAAPYVASVLIDGDKISQIIKGPLVPTSNASVIDGRGKFLMPGLIDLHAHVGLQSHISKNLKEVDSGSLSDLFRGTQEKDGQKLLQNYKTVLRFSLKSGVTTFIDSTTSLSDVALIRSAINGEEYPNFFSLGPVLSFKGSAPLAADATVDPQNINSGWKYWLPEISSKMSQGDKSAAQEILKTDLTKMIRDGGLSGLKIVVDDPAQSGQPTVPFETLKTVCDVAQSFQRPVFFISNTDQGIQDAARAGAKVKLGAPVVFDNKGNLGEASAQTMSRLAQSKVDILSEESFWGGALSSYLKNILSTQALIFQNPTVAKETADNYKTLVAHYKDQNDSDPEHNNFVKHLDDQTANEIKVHALLVKAHSQYRLAILPAGDEGAEWVFHGNFPNELALLAGRGAQSQNAILKNQEIVKAATLDSATVMNLQDSVGSVEEGKVADLLILSASPLDDISNIKKIEQVIKNGSVVNFLAAPH